MIKNKIGFLLFLSAIFLMPQALAGKNTSKQTSNSPTAIPGAPAVPAYSGNADLNSDWESPRDISKDQYFLLGGKIVNPACISPFSSGFQDDSYIRSIDLTLCQAVEGYRQVRIRKFAFPPRKLNTNVEYNYTGQDFKNGFFGYHYVGQSASDIVVLNTYHNSGGTGYIECVLLFKATENDHHMVLTRIGSILGGDRCAGGIASTSINGNILTVETYDGKSAPDCNKTKQAQYDLSRSIPNIQ